MLTQPRSAITASHLDGHGRESNSAHAPPFPPLAQCPGHGGRVECETVPSNDPAAGNGAPPTTASDIAGACASAGRSCSAAWHCPARRLSHVPRLALASTSVSASETSRPSLNCRSVTRHTMARPFRSANIRKCRGARVGATTHAFTCTRTCCCARPHLHAHARPHGPSGAKCGQISSCWRHPKLCIARGPYGPPPGTGH